MTVIRILETAVYADDLAAAEAFYVGVIGLTVFSRAEGRHVFFRVGDAMFLVFNPQATMTQVELPAHGTTAAGHAAFAIREADLDAWRQHLVGRGVRIEHEHRWPTGGHSIYFRDPAGNSIELATPKLWQLME